jgi:transcription elongation factor GreB
MSKAFTKETDADDNAPDEPDILPAHYKNYMTPQGCATLKNELRQLMNVERPKVVEVVSWAAGNGDRSENGDYIYGKKRLREIDRRIRYLSKRIENGEIVDPQLQKNLEQVFFGATVGYVRNDGDIQHITIVGIDEADFACGKISWLSPLARTLTKTRVGDVVELRTPAGIDSIEVLSIQYDASEI